MPPTITARIRDRILEIIRNAGGREVTRKDLMQQVRAEFPNKISTTSAQYWKVCKNSNVEKSRGIVWWRTPDSGDDSSSDESSRDDSLSGGAPQESNFYAPCADYLEGEEECSNAVALGGRDLGNVYGTPDVIGVLDAPNELAVYNLPREIVSVEIKTETLEADLMKGFGQACAYIAFSHRSYLAVPKNILPSSQQRLVFLCLRIGIGLILFDAQNIENPDFSIKVQAQSRMPDSSFLQKFVEKFRRSDANEKVKGAQQKLKF